MLFARRVPRLVPIVLTLAVSFLAADAAWGGTVSLAWDPVTHPELVGYRVFYGTQPGSLDQTLDVGLTPEATITGLAACTTHYVAVKARGAGDTLSEDFSNQISGWSRPVVSAVTPASVEAGSQATLVIDGSNFQAGASVVFGSAAIAVDSVTVNGCSQLVVDVTVQASASAGSSDIEVVNPDQVFGRAGGLLTINADQTAPVISSAQAGGVGPTSAIVTWSTNEPANGRVFFRPAGESAFQSTAVDPQTVTQHSVQLTGLAPDTSYDFYVQSTDAAGNTSSSVPPGSFTTASSSFTYIRFEAESGTLTPPVTRVAGAAAFGGEWVSTPSGTPNGSASNPAGTVDYGFHLPNGGSWYVWFRAFGPDSGSTSWYEGVDGAWPAVFQTSTTGSWEWVEGRTYSLTAGLHSLRVGGRRDEARVDRILITDDPAFEPGEAPGSDVTPPDPVSGLVGVPQDSASSLIWNHPANPDLDRVVVRFRTDGSYPVSPADGFPLLDEAAAPEPANVVHSGLTNGETLHYAVFAIDGWGNASARATVAVTPQAATVPPGTVLNLRRVDSVGN